MALHTKKIALAAAALAIGALAPTAGTASAENYYYILQNGANARCLDATNEEIEENGTNVQLWDCHGGDNQQWIFAEDGRIHIAINGRCLDATAEEVDENGGNVQLWDCHEGVNQRWHYDANTRLLRSVANGRCLDATNEEIEENGTNVQLWDCHGGPNQQWYF